MTSPEFSKVKLIMPQRITLKKVEPVGIVVRDQSRSNAAFKSTTKDYEFDRVLPNNGPSPTSVQFNPKFDSVHTSSPRFVDYT